MNLPAVNPRVALVRCNSYDPAELDLAVQTGMDLLGGIDTLVTPGKRVLLKPNILIGDPPDKHTTTHPAVFCAVARVFKQAGANVTYGDSPAFGPAAVSAMMSGFGAIADALEIPLADFNHGRLVTYPGGQLLKQFLIANGVLEADMLVCLPKFKTHELMRLTGAVKNLFGCIPGMVKSEMHATLKNKSQFALMLYDLSKLLQPRLCSMDAIIGMEGNGPRNGTPRKIGLLIFSNDATATDTVMAVLAGIDPLLVPTLAVAKGFGEGDIDKIEVVGEPIDACVIPDFRVKRIAGMENLSQNLFNQVLQRWSATKPVINKEKCTVCGTCVMICPVEPKALAFKGSNQNKPPVYDYDHCIRCYCCQETCPSEAISAHTPLLGKIIR